MSNLTFVQTQEFYEQVKRGRITGENYQRFVDNPDRYNENLGRFGRIYILEVNYDLDVNRLVQANKFAWKNDDVNSSNFPTKRKGVCVVKAELYEFDATVTGTEAIKKIDDDGYQCEDPHTLLTFGKQFPIEQLRRPIAGLGVHWARPRGSVCAPYLYYCGHGRRALYLCSVADSFDPYWRFLVSPRKEL